MEKITRVIGVKEDSTHQLRNVMLLLRSKKCCGMPPNNICCSIETTRAKPSRGYAWKSSDTECIVYGRTTRACLRRYLSESIFVKYENASNEFVRTDSATHSRVLSVLQQRLKISGMKDWSKTPFSILRICVRAHALLHQTPTIGAVLLRTRYHMYGPYVGG